MLWYFVVFIVLIVVIAGIFFATYKIWSNMKQKVAMHRVGDPDEHEPITHSKSGQPTKSSKYNIQRDEN